MNMSAKPATPALDIDFVRAQFPPLKDGWVFLENAGGSYVPQQVIDRTVEYMSDSQVQPNWEFESSRRATDRISAGCRRSPTSSTPRSTRSSSGLRPR